MLDPYGHGRLVLLEVNYSKDHHSNFIYLIAVFLGVIGVSRKVSDRAELMGASAGHLRSLLGSTEYRLEQAIQSGHSCQTASGTRSALGEWLVYMLSAALRLPSWLQISIVTSLASYHNPLSRKGGVEYVAEVGPDRSFVRARH